VQYRSAIFFCVCEAEEMLPAGGGGKGGNSGGRAVAALTAAQLHLARDWSGEHQLKQFLLRRYDPTTRPVRSVKTPIRVQISIALYHILDTVSTVGNVLGGGHAVLLLFNFNFYFIIFIFLSRVFMEFLSVLCCLCMYYDIGRAA